MTVPSPNLRILHGAISLDVGGLERIVLDLARRGTTRGHTVSALCLERTGTLAGELQSAGIAVTALRKAPGITPELVDAIERHLEVTKPDVIHTHQVGPLWYIGRAAARLGIPVIHTEHIDNVAKASGPWNKLKCRLLWRRAAKFADRFCCVSQDIADSVGLWGTVPRAKLAVVLNGIDADRFADRAEALGLRRSLGISDGERVIGSVGRLHEVKRQDLLIGAVADLRARSANVRLLLIGDGPEMENLTRLAETLGIRSAVVFAGYQSQPQRYLPCMDLFALTSRLEGLPLALLEAWAAGLPVVSSDVGGIPKVVDHGVNGLLFRNGDSKGLSWSLETLLADPALAEALGRAGRDTVLRSYTLDRMAEQYERHYREAIAARGAA